MTATSGHARCFVSMLLFPFRLSELLSAFSSLAVPFPDAALAAGVRAGAACKDLQKSTVLQVF